MRIIVSDTSCIIDLRKAALLRETLRLPYTFVTVNTLFEDEWLSLGDAEKQGLCDQGLEVRDLSGPSVLRAQRYFNQHRRLKLNTGPGRRSRRQHPADRGWPAPTGCGG